MLVLNVTNKLAENEAETVIKCSTSISTNMCSVTMETQCNNASMGPTQLRQKRRNTVSSAPINQIARKVKDIACVCRGRGRRGRRRSGGGRR
jgi:hypothetical protein